MVMNKIQIRSGELTLTKDGKYLFTYYQKSIDYVAQDKANSKSSYIPIVCELHADNEYVPIELDRPVKAVVGVIDGEHCAWLIKPSIETSDADLNTPVTQITTKEAAHKAINYLRNKLQLTKEQPNSWDELIQIWSSDLYNKKPLLDWLKAYWEVPKLRHIQ